MKNVILMFTGMVLTAITLLVVTTTYGRMNYSMELQSNLPGIVEETVEEMMANEEYNTADTQIFLADFVKNLAVACDGKYNLTVDIMQLDMEKGILAVRVTADFLHPNGKVGSVECERTVIFNQLQ